MRVCVLRHVAFEDEAHIGSWARARGHSLSVVNLHAGDALPAPESCDLLVVMGGPMNIYEQEAYPWLVAEKAFIRRVIDLGKAALGVCLGGQLLADVLGGSVTRNPDKEIGWLPVALTAEAQGHALFSGFPASFMAFHWHGDTFATPPGCLRAALSLGCPNQAFVHQDRVVGLQFHLESTPESIGRLIDNCRDELAPGPYIQAETGMRDALGGCKETNRLMDALLDNLASACENKEYQMRRKEKQITELPEIESILNRAEIVHLAMFDGVLPYVLPLNFAYKDGALYLHSSRKGRKVAILRARPDVAFSAHVDASLVVPADPIDACKYGMRFKSVVGHGRAELIEDEEQIKAGLGVLMARYGDLDFEFNDAVLSKTLLIKVRIAEMTGKKDVSA
jgi:GMP synthase-like glutamine amidotransferase/nitroimidazol reductase NimA-like FMN-containing flavoprotein (pyridoxamine 5'-phosphate oxidase superfamily)